MLDRRKRSQQACALRAKHRILRVWITAMLGFTLLLGSAAFTPLVEAQAQPPNRYYGVVKVNGKEQPEGTVVEAYVGNTLCGSGKVENRNGNVIYVVDVLGSGQKPNCAKDGDTVKFKVAGLDAKETGKYQTAAASHLDLSASGTARNVAQPTVLAPGAGGTPAPPPTFTAVPTLSPSETGTPAPPPTATPAVSVTGTPTASETPLPTSTGTPTATPTEAATTTPAETATAVTATSTAQSQSRSSGPPAALWTAVAVALIIIATGAGYWAYQRRPRP